MITKTIAPISIFLTTFYTAPIHARGEVNNIVDSVILGAFAHSISNGDEGGIDGNLEVRLRPFFRHGWRVEILPTLGASVNLSGDTNTAYAGATARYRLTETFFLEGFLGLTIHDADTPADANGLDLGCTLLFREGAGFGYQRGKHSFGIYVYHASHGGVICDEDKNAGITNVGVHYGYHF